jgi:hypothetical protein
VIPGTLTLTPEEWSDIVLAPENQGLLEGLAKLPPTVVEETVTELEQFRYFNQDGSLVTIVEFGEDGKVTRVVRGLPPKR